MYFLILKTKEFWFHDFFEGQITHSKAVWDCFFSDVCGIFPEDCTGIFQGFFHSNSPFFSMHNTESRISLYNLDDNRHKIRV